MFGAAALTGCTTRLGGTTVPVTPPPEQTRPETVTLGVAEYRPYALTDATGERTGEVVEVARAICDRLGTTLRVRETPFDALLPGIGAGRLDVVGGLSIRAGNCRSLDFTVPDHVSLTAIAVPPGNPKGITTFTEVVSTGARLAVVAGSLEVTAAEQAGITGIQTYPAGDQLPRAVTESRADCAAYDDITLRDLLTRTPGLELRPPFEPAGGSPRYGFGFRKGNALRDDFDRVLTELHDSGEWTRIARPFGFTKSNIPDTDRVRDRSCER